MCFPTSSRTLVIIHHFHSGLPQGCGVDSNCGFWFASPWQLMMLSIFSCTYWLMVYLFREMFIQILCPFYLSIHWIPSFYALCILDFCQRHMLFFQSMDRLLTCVSFEAQKVFVFHESLLFSHCVRLFASPRATACQVPLSYTASRSLLRFMSTVLVMLSVFSFAAPFSFCLQFSPASGSFPVSQLFKI